MPRGLINFKMSDSKKPKIAEKENNRNLYIESNKLLTIENKLSAKLENLKFESPIEYVYNPLKYAKELHEIFVNKYFEKSTKKILFLGMNPGPWGMCQTGIVFGEKDCVKDWFKITGSVEKPDKEHPKRKIFGLECHRSEISGRKFWRFFKILCETPENFFRHSFVYNLCPFAFLDVTGKNITPPEIKDKATKKLLIDICNEAFLNIIEEFNFEIVICIGKFVEDRVLKAFKQNGVTNVKVCSIPHPSPRNAKNLGKWEETIYTIFQNHNLLKFFNDDENLVKNLFIISKDECK